MGRKGGQKGGLLGFVRRRWVSLPPRRDGRKSPNRRPKTAIPESTSQKRLPRVEIWKSTSHNWHLKSDVPDSRSQNRGPIIDISKETSRNWRLKSDLSRIDVSKAMSPPPLRSLIQIDVHKSRSQTTSPFHAPKDPLQSSGSDSVVVAFFLLARERSRLVSRARSPFVFLPLLQLSEAVWLRRKRKKQM